MNHLLMGFWLSLERHVELFRKLSSIRSSRCTTSLNDNDKANLKMVFTECFFKYFVQTNKVAAGVSTVTVNLRERCDHRCRWIANIFVKFRERKNRSESNGSSWKADSLKMPEVKKSRDTVPLGTFKFVFVVIVIRCNFLIKLKVLISRVFRDPDSFDRSHSDLEEISLDPHYCWLRGCIFWWRNLIAHTLVHYLHKYYNRVFNLRIMCWCTPRYWPWGLLILLPPRMLYFVSLAKYLCQILSVLLIMPIYPE